MTNSIGKGTRPRETKAKTEEPQPWPRAENILGPRRGKKVPTTALRIVLAATAEAA